MDYTDGSPHQLDGWLEDVDILPEHTFRTEMIWMDEQILRRGYTDEPIGFDLSPTPPDWMDIAVDVCDLRKFWCAQCGLRTSTSGELDEHARLLDHVAFLCDYPGCNKSYKLQTSFARHRNVHHQTGFLCPYCNITPPKRYNRRDGLTSHIRRMHGEISSPSSSSESGQSSRRGSPDAFPEETKARYISGPLQDEKMGLKCVAASLRSLRTQAGFLDEMEYVIDSLNEHDARNLVDKLTFTLGTAKTQSCRR